MLRRLTVRKDKYLRKNPDIIDENLDVSMHHVNKWYGRLHVLRDIELEVKPKERVIISGPSGSGKSTLIRCINGLERAEEGDITVTGIPLKHGMWSLNKIRRNVGMVFQHFNLFPHLTVLENCVLAPIWVKHVGRRRAEEQAMH